MSASSRAGARPPCAAQRRCRSRQATRARARPAVIAPLAPAGPAVDEGPRPAADAARPPPPPGPGSALRRPPRPPPPAEPGLPDLDPCGATRRRIEHVPVSEDDRRYLRSLCEKLTTAYEDLPFAGPAVVLH